MFDISLARQHCTSHIKTYFLHLKVELPLKLEFPNFLIMDVYQINSQLRFDKINVRENYVAINYN